MYESYNIRPLVDSRRGSDRTALAKQVHALPFVTHAVSGLGRTIDVYSELAPDSTIGQGLAVRGETARTSSDEAQAWLNDIGHLVRGNGRTGPLDGSPKAP